MLKSSDYLDKSLRLCSSTMSRAELDEILATPGIYFASGHYLYPVSDGGRVGNHLNSLFIIEPIAAQDHLVDLIVSDMLRWIDREQIEFNLIFAPAQPAVQKIVHKLAERTGARQAFWEYKGSGWFGDKLVSGQVKPGDKALVVNGVSQQGRCVGDRLPSFVESLGGQAVAAAVFAKGTGPGVKAAEARYGSKLYSALEVDIKVQSPAECQICAGGGKKSLIPWTELRDQAES